MCFWGMRLACFLYWVLKVRIGATVSTQYLTPFNLSTSSITGRGFIWQLIQLSEIRIDDEEEIDRNYFIVFTNTEDKSWNHQVTITLLGEGNTWKYTLFLDGLLLFPELRELAGDLSPVITKPFSTIAILVHKLRDKTIPLHTPKPIAQFYN